MLSTLTLTALLVAAPVGPDAPPAPVSAPAASAASAAPAAHSGLTVVPARLEFGTVALDSTIRSSTWLVNNSLEPITVERAKAACGCTTVHFESVTLAPGAATRVAFDIETPKKTKAKDVSIRFHPSWGEPVTLTTTMHASAGAPAPVIAADAAGVMLVPVASDLGAVTAGSTVDTGAWLINAGDSVARVSRIKAGCGCTKVVDFSPADLAPGQARLVRLRVEPGAKKHGNAKTGPAKTVKLKAFVDGIEAPVHAALTMTVLEQVAGAARE